MKHRLNMEPSQASSIWPMPNINVPINIFKTINNRWFVTDETLHKDQRNKSVNFLFFIIMSNYLNIILEMCVLALTSLAVSKNTH